MTFPTGHARTFVPCAAAARAVSAWLARRLWRRASERPECAVAGAAAFASVLFMILPRIDIAVSHWFWDGRQFPLLQVPLLTMVRDANRLLPCLLIGAMLIVLATHAFARAPCLLRPHKAAFIVAFYALGPGLMVHVLKTSVGRARPAETLEFGGTLPFSPAWQISGACWRSCSFPSGESASVIALLALGLILPRRFRRLFIVLALPLAVFVSVNRLLLGAHFLSDVVLAWLLTILCMLWMWPIFRAAAEQIDAAVIGRGRTLFAKRRRRGPDRRVSTERFPLRGGIEAGDGPAVRPRHP